MLSDPFITYTPHILSPSVRVLLAQHINRKRQWLQWWSIEQKNWLLAWWFFLTDDSTIFSKQRVFAACFSATFFDLVSLVSHFVWLKNWSYAVFYSKNYPPKQYHYRKYQSNFLFRHWSIDRKGFSPNEININVVFYC